MFGVDVVRAQGEIRRRIGVVFQSPSLDRKLTVIENLRHQGHLYNLRGQGLQSRIDQLLFTVRNGGSQRPSCGNTFRRTTTPFRIGEGPLAQTAGAFARRTKPRVSILVCGGNCRIISNGCAMKTV